MRVACEVEECEVEFKGRMIPGLCVTCTRCEHSCEVGGTSDASVRRALATLKEECPQGESNYYVEE